jgi:hypothetical protein
VGKPKPDVPIQSALSELKGIQETILKAYPDRWFAGPERMTPVPLQEHLACYALDKLREHGMERNGAIIQGNRDRLRPILMTTLALVAGMIPLAVGTGPGAEERRAIAVVAIGG